MTTAAVVVIAAGAADGASVAGAGGGVGVGAAGATAGDVAGLWRKTGAVSISEAKRCWCSDEATPSIACPAGTGAGVEAAFGMLCGACAGFGAGDALFGALATVGVGAGADAVGMATFLVTGGNGGSGSFCTFDDVGAPS